MSEPFVYLAPDEVEKHGAFPFPYLGDKVPDGWTSLGPAYRYFAAQNGLGATGLLSMRDLRAKVVEVMAEWAPLTIGWGLTARTETAVLVQAYLKSARVVH